MNNIPVSILYNQMKKEINDSIVNAYKKSGLPVFLMISVLKEILCKYETDANLELVRDYQSILASMSEDEDKDKEELKCKEPIPQE